MNVIDPRKAPRTVFKTAPPLTKPGHFTPKPRTAPRLKIATAAARAAGHGRLVSVNGVSVRVVPGHSIAKALSADAAVKADRARRAAARAARGRS